MVNLATILREKGKLAQAEEMARSALEISDRTLGPVSPVTRNTAIAVWWTLKAKGGCEGEMVMVKTRYHA